MTENKEKNEIHVSESPGEENIQTSESKHSEGLEKEAVSLKEEVEKAEKAMRELRDKKEEAESKLATSLSQYIRLQADFDNFRRRTRENESKMTDIVRADTLKAFLPVIDNFEMALVQIKKSDPGDAFIQGVEMLVKQFVKTLNDFGVTEIEAQGKPFDPYFHEAVMQIVSEDLEDDTVAVVLKKGYMYKDTVLRPASVQVSHKP